ncbi:hypothetical protein [Bdellovibrio sp. HCB-110]|uniref:hypothetical protein n=1 Tax=Bdellovibrio sp. HCB-110 TaxID=3391182 RepID=UPI0039B5799F
MEKIRKTILLSLLLLTSSQAVALNLGNLQGESRREYKSPRGLSELCVIQKKWPGAVYSNSDVSKENTLCNYDFYLNVGLCPKYTSTNPAILLLEPNAQYSKEAIDASDCQIKSMKLETEAKFKQSVTCSYTPAILAYYHVSRALGNVGRVPTTVLRTMDIVTHAKLTQKANNYLSNINDPIRLSWEQVALAHKNPRMHPRLFESSLNQIYGALSDNIKKEEQYTDVSGHGDYDSRYQRFLRQKPFLRVASSQSVSQQVGTTEFTQVAQVVLQMKDVADMVLIDTLLNQQDRIGNIHYKFFWYYIDPQTNKLVRRKSDAKVKKDSVQIPEEESREMSGLQAALLKEMVLKDNDCGVTKTNMMKKIGALDKVRHFSYATYRGLLYFEQALNTPAAKDYFMTELLFAASEYKSLLKNTQEAKRILMAKCQSGDLHFDVDLETYIPGTPPPTISCAL